MADNRRPDRNRPYVAKDPNSGDDSGDDTGPPDKVFYRIDGSRVKKKCERCTQKWLPECDYEDNVENGTQQKCNNCVIKDCSKFSVSIPCLRPAAATVNRDDRGPMARHYQDTGHDLGLDRKTRQNIDAEGRQHEGRRLNPPPTQRGSRHDIAEGWRREIESKFETVWSEFARLRSDIDRLESRDQPASAQSNTSQAEVSMRKASPMYNAFSSKGAPMDSAKRRRDDDEADDTLRRPFKKPDTTQKHADKHSGTAPDKIHKRQDEGGSSEQALSSVNAVPGQPSVGERGNDANATPLAGKRKVRRPRPDEIPVDLRRKSLDHGRVLIYPWDRDGEPFIRAQAQQWRKGHRAYLGYDWVRRFSFEGQVITARIWILPPYGDEEIVQWPWEGLREALQRWKAERAYNGQTVDIDRALQDRSRIIVLESIKIGPIVYPGRVQEDADMKIDGEEGGEQRDDAAGIDAEASTSYRTHPERSHSEQHPERIPERIPEHRPKHHPERGPQSADRRRNNPHHAGPHHADLRRNDSHHVNPRYADPRRNNSQRVDGGHIGGERIGAGRNFVTHQTQNQPIDAGRRDI